MFDIDTAGRALYVVELASAPRLMSTLAERTQDNYFHGGDVDSVFATGPNWCIPPSVWTRLRSLAILYYRVIVLDQATGSSRPSIDDHHLDRLPSVIVER